MLERVAAVLPQWTNEVALQNFLNTPRNTLHYRNNKAKKVDFVILPDTPFWHNTIIFHFSTFNEV